MIRKLLTLMALLSCAPLWAAIAIEGTAATTSETAAGTSHTVNLPSSIQANELLGGAVICDDVNKTLSATGWTFVESNSASSSSTSVGFMYRVADGAEGSTVTVTTSASCTVEAVVARFSGVGTTDPTGSDNFSNTSVGSVTSTFSISANTLTSLTSGDGVLVLVSAEASRTVSSADADLTSVGSVVGNPTIHFYVDLDAGGTGNQQYDFTMSDTRDYDLSLMQWSTASASTSAIFRRGRAQ